MGRSRKEIEREREALVQRATKIIQRVTGMPQWKAYRLAKKAVVV